METKTFLQDEKKCSALEIVTMEKTSTLITFSELNSEYYAKNINK